MRKENDVLFVLRRVSRNKEMSVVNCVERGLSQQSHSSGRLSSSVMRMSEVKR